MRNLIMIVAALAMVSTSDAKPSKKHALVKVASATTVAVKKSPAITFKAVKATLGSVLFTVETVNDVALGGLIGLDKAASMELKYNPFHYAAVVDGKIDVGLEKAELYLFGSSN